MAFFLGALASIGLVQAHTRSDPSDPDSEPTFVDLNVRLVWGGPTAARYVGTLELDGGTIACTQQLGIDTNDPSFLLKDPMGKFTFHDEKTRFGGCDLHLQARSNHRLKLQLQTEDKETSETVVQEYVWTLKSLRDGPEVKELGNNGCRLSIDRAPGDRLRVVTSRSHLVYNSEEPLSLQIQPHALPWQSTQCNFECTLVRLDDDAPVYRKTKQIALDGLGNGEPYNVLTVAPKDEGVYELRFKIEPKRILPGIMVKYPSVDRSVQFVVYNNSPASSSSHVSSRDSVDEVDDSRWKPQSQPSLPAFEIQSLTSRLAGRVDNSRRFPFLEIARSLTVLPLEFTSEQKKTADDAPLQVPPSGVAVVSLNHLSQGELHRLSIDSSSGNAAFRVAIQSKAAPDAKPDVTLANEVFDASIARSLNRAIQPANISADENFALLFWPNSQTAQLEITNLNPNSPLDVQSVVVDVWGEATHGSNALLASFLSPNSILELHSPNVRGAFENEPVSDISSKRIYDDWQLFLRFAKHAAVYCKANGFEALAMLVHSEGSSLFPSTKLSCNARFDTGTFSSAGRDPLRKDVVELMYRVLSRYGVEFIPMLELAGPIRDVAEASSKADSNELFQHRDASLAIAGRDSQLYNPLCQRVQQAIAVALDEFEKRYRSQPSYRGFALRASSASHLILSLPIEQTNPRILDRFGASVAGNLPKESVQREQFISQRMQAAYSQWQQEAVFDFLANLKSKPKWVSTDQDAMVTSKDISRLMVHPVAVGPQTKELASVPASVATQWNVENPSAIHIAMERPVKQWDDAFARLGHIAKGFPGSNLVSLPYRENARSLSKVRIWSSRDGGPALLVSNSGAISESIHLAWETLPTDFRFMSSLNGERSHSDQRVEIDASTSQWKLQIAAGEAIRIDLLPEAELPLYWYSLEALVARSLESALVSIEQAVGRLSLPQPRTATLSNPSFESQNNNSRRGRLSGWATSIDPNATVELDARTATDGKLSVKIESNSPSSIAWIQSDPFAMPPGDRMMVSLQAAADPIPQIVSVSLSKYDPKSDRFETIAVRDIGEKIQRPSNQVKWGYVGIDLSNEFQVATQNNEPGLFRLQFETAGVASLWLDDIAVSTSFLRDGERRDLRSELFLARNSLQSGDSTPAVAMLQSARGRLVLWSDPALAHSKVMVSSPVDRELQGGSKSVSSENRILPETQAEGTATDGVKQRPMQRWRNYWWSRKE